MKKSFLVVLLLLVSFSSIAQDKILRVEIGSNSGGSTEDLRNRIYYLEMAVRQLQDRVFELELRRNSAPVVLTPTEAVKMYTCSIETPFNGTFTSTKTSKGEARGDVMKQCSEKAGGSFYCGKGKVECDE